MLDRAITGTLRIPEADFMLITAAMGCSLAGTAAPEAVLPAVG